MKEIERGRRLADREFKRLNDKLENRRRSSSNSDGTVEAAATVSKYNEQLRGILEMNRLLDELEGRESKETEP